ncbi:MAG TPA: hypothetical protein VFV87_14450 [Pirellulaceae bacterium]|nr:hypothetical protein [Pirellulaceae bacterium]
MNRREAPHNMQCISARESALCHLRNCQLLVAGHGTAYPSAQFRGRPQGDFIVENCLIGQQLLFYVTHDQPMRAALNHNTVLELFLTIRHHHQLDLAARQPGAGEFQIETSSNILGGPLMFVQPQEFVGSEVEFSGQACERVLRQVVTWRENGNLYSSSDGSELLRLFLEPGNAPPRQRLALETPLNDLPQWKNFWALESLNSLRGEAKFQGGSLVAKAKFDPEALTPDLFRLRPDSPGYRAGSDGKDLGADVDLVGPGAAYERWKRTPEYKQWLKETRQVKSQESGVGDLEPASDAKPTDS